MLCTIHLETCSNNIAFNYSSLFVSIIQKFINLHAPVAFLLGYTGSKINYFSIVDMFIVLISASIPSMQCIVGGAIIWQHLRQ